MKACLGRLGNGFITENPVFTMALGLCPTLAVMTSAVNAIGMGLSSLVVLMPSNSAASVLSGVIPGRVRLPAKIVVVASLMTVVQFLIQGFVSSIHAALGIYVPLIVVNYIIPGRAEVYTLGAELIPAFFNGLGIGFGLTLALLLLGSFYEIIGAGSTFGIKLIPDAYHISIFVLPPDVFFVMASLIAGMQHYQDNKRDRKGRPTLLEETKTKVAKPAIKLTATAATAQTTVTTTAVEVKNPAMERKEGAKRCRK